MVDSFAYREERFTPAEAAACTGLSLAMQRDWRRHGHLPARSGGTASFGPRELAEMRLMVLMRQMGLGPSKSRGLAQEAAPSLVWLILVDHPSTWAVEGPAETAAHYRDKLEALGDSHLRSMAGLHDRVRLYGVAEGEEVDFVTQIAGEEFDNKHELITVLSLRAVAAAMAAALDRPLFTILAR